MSDTAHSVVAPSRAARRVAAVLVVAYAVITLVPLVWIVLTGFKSPSDAISYPPKLLFEPTLEGYVNLFTTRSRQSPEVLAGMPAPDTWYDRLARTRNMVIVGPSPVHPALRQLAGDRGRVHGAGGGPGDLGGLCVLPLPGAGGG